MNSTVKKITRNVIFIEHERLQVGDEITYLLRGDAHHDSVHCDWQFEKSHLDKAAALDAGIIDVGDIFDVMQGRNDPRRAYSDIKPEFAKQMIDGDRSYFDIAVDDLAEFYAPYAKNWKLLSKGNHESSVERMNDTNLIERLANALYMKSGVSVPTGGYGGYVKFMFPSLSPVVLKYFHGSGGGGPVTKGVIQSNRQAVFLPDADIVVNGHIHESWLLAITRERLSTHGVVSLSQQYHVRSGTYKNEYGDGSGGWHIETGKPPKAIGAVWLKFFVEDQKVRFTLTQDIK